MDIMKMFQKNIFDSIYSESHLRDVTFAVVGNVLAEDESNSVNRPSMN
jgi:hypothetical protein